MADPAGTQGAGAAERASGQAAARYSAMVYGGRGRVVPQPPRHQYHAGARRRARADGGESRGLAGGQDATESERGLASKQRISSKTTKGPLRQEEGPQCQTPGITTE